MITFEVSTWAQIVNIATQSQADAFTENVTIKLIADIDCNDSIPEGVESTLNFKFLKNASMSITIDGGYDDVYTNRHVIRNLRTHILNPVYIFRGTNASTGSSAAFHFTLRNIDFINLILDKELLFLNSVWTPIDIVNCRFAGERSCSVFAGYFNANYTHNIIRSYFNMEYSDIAPTLNELLIFRAGGGTATLSSLKMAFCRIVESYDGWQPDDTKHCTSFGNAILSGCRISGEIVGGSVLTLTTKYDQDSSVQNVIDADLKTTAEQGTTITVNAPDGVWRNDIHSTDASITTTYAYTNTNQYALPETPADMVNTRKLRDDGFDVVV